MTRSLALAGPAASHEAEEEIAVTAVGLDHDSRILDRRSDDRFARERVEDRLRLLELRYAQRVGIDVLQRIRVDF